MRLISRSVQGARFADLDFCQLGEDFWRKMMLLSQIVAAAGLPAMPGVLPPVVIPGNAPAVKKEPRNSGTEFQSAWSFMMQPKQKKKKGKQ